MNSEQFELRLGHQLRQLADTGLRPINATQTAETVIAHGRRRRFVPHLVLPRTVGGVPLVWLGAILLLMLLAFAAVFVGARQLMGYTSPLQALAVVRGGELFVADSVDGALSEVVRQGEILGRQNPVSDVAAVKWAPNGEHLALALGQEFGDTFWHGVAVVGKAGDLTATSNLAGAFEWAPDAQHLLALPIYLDVRRPGMAMLIGLDPGVDGGPDKIVLPEELPLPEHGNPLALGFEPSGEAVIVLANVRPVFEGGRSYESDPNGTDSIWLVDVANDAAPQALGELHNALSVAVSPNGQQLAYAWVDSTDERRVVTDIASLGSTTTCSMRLQSQSAAGGYIEATSLSWSPDGQRVAAIVDTSDGSGLWVGPANCSQPPQELVSGTSTGTDLEENSAERSGDPLRVTAGEWVHGPIQWSADGRWMYYRGLTAEDQAGTGLQHLDLRRVAADGGASQLITQRVEWFDLEVPQPPSE